MNLYPRLILHRMHVYRHTAPVIHDADCTVPMERHVNPVGMTAKSLIYRVINDLLREVIRPGGVGVHPGPFTALAPARSILQLHRRYIGSWIKPNLPSDNV